MEALFLHLLNMSLTASWLVLAVLLVRAIFKKAPKALLCLLWAIVAVRLLCPISLESVFSLVPSAEPIPQEILFSPAPSIDSGIPIVNEAVNPALSESLAPNPGDSVNPIQILAAIAANVWVLGVVTMLVYAVISYIRVYRKVRIRMPLDARTCLCDDIDTPFIFGILRPQVFLPSSLSDADRSYVIAHEQAHLKRLDHVWKPLGFALLTVYWFNPLLWVAYIILCRDIELACDEKVIRDMNREDTAAYTQALLHCSSKQKFVTACPLAFGESGVKVRIKNALNYKKPAFWLVLPALIACIAVTVCFLTDPLKRDNEPDSIGAGSELDGVSVAMKELDLSAEQPTLTIRWQNDTGKELIYGESFRLYRLEDGRLIDTNLVKNSGFSAIGLMLAPYQHADKAYNLTGYNLSENGIYRFESTIGIHGGGATSYKVWVDFAVENGTATTPLIAATASYTIGGAVFPDTKENVRVIYPVLESDTQDFEILNTFLKNNIEEKLYHLQQEYPRGSAIELYFTVNYDDGTLISVLFAGTVTPPEGDAVDVAFTACLAPGNGYTVNPESLFMMDDYFLNTFRDKWLALWEDANVTFELGQEIQNTINGYSNEELAALLRDGKTADFGFTQNGILVVFRGRPNVADFRLIEIPLTKQDESSDTPLASYAVDQCNAGAFSTIDGRLVPHTYTAATCDTPQTCTACGKVLGKSLGHTFVDITCTSGGLCSRCGKQGTETAPHTFSAATCIAGEICTACGANGKGALGHASVGASCTSGGTCSRCNVALDDALGHSFSEATCLAPATCERCGITDGETVEHFFEPDGVCMWCGEYPQTVLDHIHFAATCEGYYCEECGEYVDGGAHFLDAFGSGECVYCGYHP